MFVLTIVLAAVTGFAFAAAGLAKLVGVSTMDEAQRHLGLAMPLWKAVGALELLGAVGVLVGLHEDLPIIGVLAGAGLVGLTIGATFYHQRAGDRVVEWLPAVVMGSLVIFYGIARVGSA